MSDATPISWMTLEKGTPVFTSDGESLGKVSEIVADRQQGIFSGIAFSAGLLDADRFVPADCIDAITTERLTLNVSQHEAGTFGPYED